MSPASSGGGDYDYEEHGRHYTVLRRTDERIARMVHDALGATRRVVNVGAGAGSYEPVDRHVVAVEPSATMRAQRAPGAAPAVSAFAERLPFGDGTFDAGMAMVTIHQWSDVDAGLRELRRVAKGPVVVLTFDRDALCDFWLARYSPELMRAERRRYPALSRLALALGGELDVLVVPIPIDCVDGFTEAYYARPEEMLRPEVRRSQSAWGFVEPDDEDRAVRALARDLADGTWDAAFGYLRRRPSYAGSLRLVVSRPR